MHPFIGAFLEGAALNFGLIVAIGAQNAFVLAQGLARRFALAVALTCSVCDALLIFAGIVFANLAQTLGGGVAAAMLTLAGAVYLLWFGARAARAAMRGDSLSAADGGPKTARAAIAASLALSLLNPHAILDMSIVFGGVAASLPKDITPFFALGGAAISFVWFFALAFGAGKLSPLLSKPSAWRVINGGIAAIMFLIAASLLVSLARQWLN